MESVWGCSVSSDLMCGVRYGACDAVLKARVLSQQDSSLVNEMAESGAEGDLPQRRLGVKEQQNGELTGKNKIHLIYPWELDQTHAYRYFSHSCISAKMLKCPRNGVKRFCCICICFIWKGSCVYLCSVRLDSVPSVEERKERDREERESLVLWKKPLLTLHYFTLELLITLKEWIWRWGQGWDAASSPSKLFGQ